jgi:tRNA dimethylallyltransferase
VTASFAASSAAARPRATSTALAIVGPTGVGKTAVAVRVGTQTGGEIVSVDSRQVYRGLEICTNAPTAEELGGVRCHLVGCLAVGEKLDAARYVAMAMPVIDNLAGEGRRPILTAGTGLYLRALLEGLDLGGHPADPTIREGLEAAADHDLAGLHRRLVRLDPEAAARVEPTNPVRVVRATELALRRRRGDRAAAGLRPLAAIKVGLFAPRAQLYKWIEARTDRLLSRGWQAEVGALLDAGVDLSRTALTSIGLREMAAYIQGRESLASVRAVIIQRTRNYAKRQLTWFRRDPEVRWLDVTRYSQSDIVEPILEMLEKP